MTFHEKIIFSLTFKAWKMKKQNSLTFQVFHDPVIIVADLLIFALIP